MLRNVLLIQPTLARELVIIGDFAWVFASNTGREKTNRRTSSCEFAIQCNFSETGSILQIP